MRVQLDQHRDLLVRVRSFTPVAISGGRKPEIPHDRGLDLLVSGPSRHRPSPFLTATEQQGTGTDTSEGPVQPGMDRAQVPGRTAVVLPVPGHDAVVVRPVPLL